MSLPVNHNEFIGDWGEYVEQVEDQEEQIASKLAAKPLGVPENLQEMIEKWQNGEKALRSFPVVNVFEEYSEGSTREIRNILLGLDTQINNYDDLIDSKELSKKDKVDLMSRVALSTPFTYRDIPEELEENIDEITSSYLTKLFQIPLEERTHVKRMNNSESLGEVLKHAEKCYNFRSEVVDGFVDLTAEYLDIDEADHELIRDDLRNLVARKQIVKDLYDIEQDLEDNDLGPSARVIEQANSTKEAVQAIKTLYDEFNYSNSNLDSYGTILGQLEPERHEINREAEDVYALLNGD